MNHVTNRGMMGSDTAATCSLGGLHNAEVTWKPFQNDGAYGVAS